MKEFWENTTSTLVVRLMTRLTVAASCQGRIGNVIAAYPQAKQTDASLIIESAFIKRIDDSGFVRALYKK